MRVKFQCLKCGECCKHLIQKVPFGKAGMFLLPWERHIFPENKILPLFGVGIKGRSRKRPKEIIAYQYTEDRCQFLNKKNLCSIYDHKPTACEGFPLEVTSIGNIVSGQICTFFKNLPTKDLYVKFPASMIQANLEIYNYLLKAMRQYSFTWNFDLESRRWKLCTLKDLNILIRSLS